MPNAPEKAPAPPDDRVIAALLSYGELGQQAAGFWRTAWRLQTDTAEDGLDQRSELVAYCCREMLDRLLRLGGNAPGVVAAARDAVTAWNEWRGEPGSDAAVAVPQAVVDAMGRLRDEVTNPGGRNARRLTAVVGQLSRRPVGQLQSTAAARWTKGIANAASVLHGNGGEVDARDLYETASEAVRLLFVPLPDRLSEIDQLLVNGPSAQAATAVSSWADPRMLDYFFSRITDPGWLDVLDDITLRPGPRSWAALPFLRLLADDDPRRVARWMAPRLDSLNTDADRIFLLQLARSVGLPAADIVLMIIRRPTGDAAFRLAAFWVHSIVPGARSSDGWFGVADRLVDHAIGGALPAWHGQRVLREMLGVARTPATSAQWRTRAVAALAGKLRRTLAAQPHEWTGRVPLREVGLDDPLPVWSHALAQTLVLLLDTADAADDDTSGLLARLQRLEPNVRRAVSAAFLAGPARTRYEAAANNLAVESLQAGDFDGDTAALVRAVATRASTAPELVRRLTAALGAPPDPLGIDRTLALGGAEAASLLRLHRWLAILPPAVTAEFAEAEAVLADALGPVELPRPRVSGGLLFRTSPLSLDSLRALDPLAAARQIGQWRSTSEDERADSIGLADTLNTLVTEAAEAWQEQPADVVAALGHPRYVDAYFRALAGIPELRTDRGADLAAAILDVVAGTRAAVPILGDESRLSRMDPGFVAGSEDAWQAVEPGAIALLTQLWRQALDLRGFDQPAAQYVLDRAADHSAPSRIQLRDGDPLTFAISRPFGEAWQAAAAWAAAHVRRGEPAPESFVHLTDRMLGWTGEEGRQARALIATQLHWLAQQADWLDHHGPQLFGPEADAAQAQSLLRSYASWGVPTREIIEAAGDRFYPLANGYADALSVIAYGLVHHVAGYAEPATVVDQLAQIGARLVSDLVLRLAGAAQAADDPAAVIASYWRAALDAHLPPDAYPGFGELVDLPTLDGTTWLTLVADTAGRALMQRPGDNAERASRHPTSPIAADLLAALLDHNYGHDEWNRAEVADHALRFLEASQDQLTLDVRERLRAALIEAGMFAARDLP